MACEEGSIAIPQDIITSILYRLPVKSLCRFRCVSKEWQSLFSEPHFIKTHTKTLNRTHLIFGLRTCTWRQLSDSPYDYSQRWCHRGVFVNGFIHWIARKGSDHIPVIVAFSLADETFSEVPSPDLYNNGHKVSLDTCNLVALDGKLAIFCDVGLVWLMNEYGVEKSWTKIVVQGYNEITMIKPENLFATHDLTRIYYLEEGSLPKSADICNMNLHRIMSTYVESLVSPKLDRVN
ncbi:F-box associated interaction domain-containing protein [Artemisia annua]|uniref:F-box associated interaction domain-containing protein n=1 Tax=Artemisia annua TaxID=35608 RepID=A0A2U1N8J5_ARTAN|nr:F-box associated interaction domain-containing protein [Artemisia annua]